MCSVGISSSREVMEKLKGRGKARTWFLFVARLDAGARFVCTLLKPLAFSLFQGHIHMTTSVIFVCFKV